MSKALRTLYKQMADLFIPPSNTGFFSSCSLQLARIAQYINKNKRCPDSVDRSKQFEWYKPADASIEEYFETVVKPLRYGQWIHFEHYYQFLNYKTLDFKPLQRVIEKFFAPSKEIREIVVKLERTYNIDYEKTFVVFYRGNDKVTETSLGSYDDFVARARKIQEAHPDWRCLVQSDETEFIERMLKEFPTAFYFKDEIRHIPRAPDTTVDKVLASQNFQFSKNFLAVTLIMARAAHIICGTGNCSLWIALYRGGASNMDQFFDKGWV